MSLADIAYHAGRIAQTNNLRKNIFEIQKNLRGTPQFAELFYQLIGQDIHHPPKEISGTQQGVFWTAGWEPARGAYEPFTTQKVANPNIAYQEGCALFLLIQEIYPNVYKFPNNTTDQVMAGAGIQLLMRKEYIGRPLMPAYTPGQAPAQSVAEAPVQPIQLEAQPVQAAAQPVQTAPQPTQSPAQAAVLRFCPNCGTKRMPGARFCSACGTKLG